MASAEMHSSYCHLFDFVLKNSTGTMARPSSKSLLATRFSDGSGDELSESAACFVGRPIKVHSGAFQAEHVPTCLEARPGQYQIAAMS